MRPIRNTAFLARKIGDDLVLYDPGGDIVHTLNSTSRFIWERCDGVHTPADIAAELTACYAVSIDVARRDVHSTLSRLQDLGLVRQEKPA